MTDERAALAIALMAGITVLLRYFPFIAFGRGSKTPGVITDLGKVLPYSIMAMLVVYCLKDVNFGEWRGFLPHVIAISVVVILHLKKRNALFCIASGTAVYMALVQLVF